MNKKYKNIDDFVRDRFEHFEPEPPEHVWKSIRGSLDDRSFLDKLFPGSGWLGIAGLMLIAGSLLFYFLNPFELNSNEFRTNTGQVKMQPSSQALIAQNGESGHQRGIESENVGRAEINPDKTPGNDKDKTKKSKHSGKPVTINPKLDNQLPAVIAGKTNLVTPESPTSHAISLSSLNEHRASATHISFMKSRTVSLENYQSDREPILVRSFENTDFANKFKSTVSVSASVPGVKSDYGEKGAWLFGFSFTPELIYYHKDDKLKNYSYSLDLQAIYKKENYFLQSGIGLARIKDGGNYRFDYNKYLGSYQDVYNVVFDTTSGEVVPEYYTQTVNVYDSVNYIRISPTNRYFTYLQIPLLMGYGQDYPRFGWYVKAGPSVSILVHRKIPAMSSMMEGPDKILNAESNLPSRINSNWQFILAAGGMYKISNNVNLYMEPMYRYYIQSAYEQNRLKTRHPRSLGLRAGILLNF